MSPIDFKKILYGLPFKPFRLHISDGRTFDIYHPDLVTCTKSTLFLRLKVDPATGEYQEDAETVGLLHVTGTTPLSLLPAAEPVAA